MNAGMYHADLSPVGELPLPTEGWGVCALDGRLVVSDGSDTLTFYDPTAMTAVGSIAVTDAGTPVTRLNELELVATPTSARISTRQPRLNSALSKPFMVCDLSRYR